MFHVSGSSLLLLPLKKSYDNVTVSSYSHEKTDGLTDPMTFNGYRRNQQKPMTEFFPNCIK